MIDELHIRGLGVIEDATLRLSPGLTVVTGETGAGKTMVVTALEQLLGARADSDLVRAGAPAVRLEARLSPVPESAREWAEGDDELVVSREIPADGRSRARINGRLAPVSALADAVGPAVEVHAQDSHVRLTRPEVQRRLLDRYAGPGQLAALERYREAYDEWRRLSAEKEEAEVGARERARTIERLRFEVEEIEAAGIREEDEGLDDRIEVLEHAEELGLATARAAAALGAEGVAEPLGVAIDAVRRLEVSDEALDGLRGRLLTVAEEVADLAAELRDYGESIDADPARLEELRARQRLLRDLRRKYGDTLEEVVAYAGRISRELADLERREETAGSLDQRIRDALDAVVALAEQVGAGRREAAERLTDAVSGHLADLAMPHAAFSVRITGIEPGRDGADEVVFLLAPNPGEPPRPVGTAASGGERSRVALAVEVALADVADARVLVFDEVDAGIGGATAMAVGAKLARLARGPERDRQVLCVTHLAQLAAFADVHHVVEKHLVDGRTVTTARQVAEGDRIAEIARMLGGDAERAAGLQHARELLEEARGRGAGGAHQPAAADH